MLRYTGHPYIDIGVATITAFAGKKKPEQLSVKNLEAIADYMATNYMINPLRSFLTVAFLNSGFTQFAYFEQPDKQQLYAERVLRSFRSEVPNTGERDIFLDSPIPAISFDVKGQLAHGRAFRQHIPLLTGEDVINFFPHGEAGLPISGEALLAIQAFPLGCEKASGRLLAVHSDNPDITFHFASKFLENNRKKIQLAEGSNQFPESHLFLKTLVVKTLLDASQQQSDYAEDEVPFSITVYHVGSGKDPRLDIYHLPLEVIGFLQKMMRADFIDEWTQIVQLSWEVAPERRVKKEKEQPFIPRMNFIYQDAFELPNNATRFVRKHFLYPGLRIARSDSTTKYIVSWKIIQEFLRRIMHMNKEHIDQIREIGDSLAAYVKEQNDKDFFRNFRTTNYRYFRTSLLRASLAQVRRGRSPLLGFEPYVEVFEYAENDARPDWGLARDLVMLRMIEKLKELKWFDENSDSIPEIDTTEDQPTQ
jgi:CRISPR-associated protein Cst1